MKQVSEKPKVRIKATRERGQGVFATRIIHKGELAVRGKKVKQVLIRTTHSFQMDFSTHVQLDKTARSINHSCDPNTGVRNNMLGGYDFIALRSIKKDEEITWNYETTEYVSIAVKTCLCGSKNCKRIITGFKYQSEYIVERFGIYIANYLKIAFYNRNYYDYKMSIAQLPARIYYREES